MASKNTKYAVDLSNDGVSLWHRGEDKAWNVLGKVALSSETFSDDVENLKTGYEPNIGGKFIAQVRIPRSEVFVSEIDLDGLTGAAATSKTKSFLSDKTPYQAQDLVFDLENNGAGKTSYVAAIAKQTIKEAKEFILGYGFEASFYTSKIDKTEFPRNPRFYDGKPPIVAPPLQSETVKETPQKTKVDEDVTPPALPISPPLPPIKIKEKVADIKAVTTTTPKQPEPEINPVPEVNKVEEKPLSATSTTDFSSFETIRSKSLIAPSKSGKKIEPTIAKAPPLPPRRISIDLPKPVEKTATGAIKNPITMPQGGGLNTNTGGFFKPKYALGIAALIVVALLYWFFTELFDGKEEISRLQETPQTEPTAILEPAVLKPINSNDAAPVITLDAVQEAHQIPNLEAPKLAAAPEPLTVAKGSVNDAGGEQLITEEQVAETLNEVANADTQQQEVATIEPDAPTAEQPESVGETASPDLPTEVALVDLIPTKNGTPGAEGITLFAGQPDIIPPPREQLKISTDPLKNILPKMRSVGFEETHKTEAVIEPVEQAVAVAIADETTALTDPVEDAVDTTEIEIAAPDILALADPTLKSKRPKLRPSTILQQAKEAQNSLLTKANPELAGLKPRIRPRNLSIPKEVVEPVIVEPAKIDPSEIEVAVQEAVRNIARPRARPRSLSKIAARAKASAKANSNATRTAALTPSTATGTSKPSAATPTGVQKEATEKAGFSKRRISLIGVYGTASSRRALVRLPSGRFVKVKAGQRVSGWKVSAIGESSVRISKGSRNQVLRMPK